MNAIFAVNSINGFGQGSTMPWPHSRSDLQRFKQITSGHTVVMGSQTWLSDMPKPLPNRRNIVLSTTLVDSRCEVFTNITSLLMNLAEDEQVFVIGGASVLWALRPYINRVYFTKFHSALPATITLDTQEYFKDFECHSREEMDEYTIDIRDRI